MREQKDRERSVYGLKEKNLAKIYIKLIPLGRNDPDAIRLLNWKKPTEKEVCPSLCRIHSFVSLLIIGRAPPVTFRLFSTKLSANGRL